MISDSFFQIGSSHLVCQDYALHGENHAIVADGCSSERHTDWGARLLSLAAQNFISLLDFESIDSFLTAVRIATRFQYATLVNLPETSLVSTLLLTKFIRNKRSFLTILAGDGIFGGRKRDTGHWDIYIVDSNNHPFYQAYLIFNDELPPVLRNKVYHYYLNRDWEILEIDDYPVDFRKNKSFLQTPFPIDIYDMVFVATDGLSSFHEKDSMTRKKIDTIKVLEVLLDFLSYPKCFLQLQHDWSFKQDKEGTFIRRGWYNFDDVAVAALYSK